MQMMKWCLRGVAVAAGWMVFSGNAQDQGNEAADGQGFTLISSDATYGCRRSHGYGLYDGESGQTFLCWNGPGMSVMGRSYNHQKGEWSPVKEISRLDYTGTWAYHDYPNMVLAPDGRLVIAWAEHCVNLQIARAEEPHDLSGAWKSRVISQKRCAYPMIFRVGQDIYIFYSVDEERSWPYRSFGYIKSSDSGLTWSEHHRAIDSEKQDPNHIDEIYAFDFDVIPGTKDNPVKVTVTWVMRGGPKGHNIGSRNAYMAYFLPDNGQWQSVDGTQLGDWIDFQEMMQHCLLVDTGPVLDKNQINRVLASSFSSGKPLLAYNDSGVVHQLTWDGEHWRGEKVAEGDAKDMRRQPDGRIELLYSLSATTLSILAKREGDASWQETLKREIPYRDGANSTRSMAFIDQGRPELAVLMSQVKREDAQSDYSGKWPVWVMTVPEDK